MRSVWATSTTAVLGSALVGVLLGAYLHELHVNRQDAGPSARTAVRTTVSTVVVTMSPLTAALSPDQQAAVRPPGATARPAPGATSTQTSTPEQQPSTVGGASTTTTIPSCNPLNPFPPATCRRTSTPDTP